MITNLLHRSIARLSMVLMTLVSACGTGGDMGDAPGAGGPPPQTPIASIRMTPETKQIAVGERITISAQALDAAGQPIAGKTFAIASMNPAIASSTGLTATSVEVAGVAHGVVNVVATAEGKEGRAIVTVSGFMPVQLSGRVLDGETLQPLAGAQVASEISSSFATTGSDGSFTMTVPNTYNEAEIVDFTASLSGYESTTLRSDIRPPDTVLEPILIVKPRTTPGSVSGGVRNARDNSGIAGATVFINKGQGGAGTVVASTTTDSQGGYSFSGLPAGVYTLITYPSGFAFCKRTVVSLGTSATATQNLFCSPSTASDLATRIVLTWGNSPSDLDAHLSGPNANDANRFHVYFLNSSRGSLAASPFALLDIDQRNGSGPETITINRLASGVYRFSVHDYSNRSASGSTALGNSRAIVELYLPGRTTPEVFNVPVQPGNLWTVFELVGSPSDPSVVTVTARNEMGFLTDEATVQ
ncbi:MAG: carboxypeptidase regulatory-like domain-containing protein [Lautropia sp.]